MSVPSAQRGLDMRSAVTVLQCSRNAEFRASVQEGEHTHVPSLYHALLKRILASMKVWPHAEEEKTRVAQAYAASGAVLWTQILRGDTVYPLIPDSYAYFVRAVPNPEDFHDPSAQVSMSKALQHIRAAETEARFRSKAEEGEGEGEGEGEAGAGDADLWPIGEDIPHAAWAKRARKIVEEDREAIITWLKDVQDPDPAKRKGTLKSNAVWDAVLPIMLACAPGVTAYFSTAEDQAAVPPHFYADA